MKPNAEAKKLCEEKHRAIGQPTNGFGWRGWWCPECGYSHFVEWEDWAKDLVS